MGGENSKESQVQNEESNLKEQKAELNQQNNSNKKNTKSKLKKDKNEEDEDEDEEEEEEEDDEEEKEKGKEENNKQNNNQNKNPQRNNNKEKTNKKNIKIKKEEKYFSIEESYSSKSKSDKKSSNKSISNKNININNLSEFSSYIDERLFNTNTSLNFSIKSKNSKDINNPNNIDISSESVNPNYPKIAEKGYIKGDNKYFGDFNNLDQDFIYKKKIKQETEEEESETDMTLPLKERVYNECNRHKYYLDTNEKGAYTKINKKSFSNPKRYKYRKSILLHKKEITCLISLSGTIKKICYASSSIDKNISLWDSFFFLIYKIKCDEWYSNYLIEFDTTYILSCESNHIKMYDLITEHYDCVKIFKDHINDIYCLLSVIDEDEEKFIFLSGGKDKTIRLWDHEMDAPIKYYEGHYSTVTQIVKFGNDKNKVISCSEDKTFIVWDIRNNNPLKIYNNYFNHLCIAGDSIGFCCGAYDNKIRLYNNEYILIKCIVSKLFGITKILMIDDYCMLIVDIDNNMHVLDLDEDENNLALIYTGYEDEIVNVTKSFNWDNESQNNKVIVVACKNGYVYLYSFEYELKNDKKKNNSENKKHKCKKKKNK